MNILVDYFLLFFRKLSGTDRVLKKQAEHEQQQQQRFLSLGNGLKYYFTAPEEVKATITYKRCAQIVSLLSPADVEAGEYIRVGRGNDGGYVMLNNFHQSQVEAAYSFGISDDVSWDEAIACMGYDVFMYDHTIKKLPKNHPRFHYFKTGVTGNKKGANLKKLRDLIVENGHQTCRNLILKMDIEGCEWDVFKETPEAVMNQFSQLVIEWHGLTSIYGNEGCMIVDILKKINQTHQCVHVHANGTSTPLWIGDIVLPSLLEVTYVRKKDFENKFIANQREFPTKLDEPTLKNMPDIYLGRFFNEGL